MKTIDERVRKRAAEFVELGIETLGKICQGLRPAGFCKVRVSQLVSAVRLLSCLSEGELPEVIAMDVRRITRLRDLLHENDELEGGDVLDADLQTVLGNELPALLPAAQLLDFTERTYLTMSENAFEQLVDALKPLGTHINQNDSARTWVGLDRDDRVELIVAAARDLASTAPVQHEQAGSA